MERNSREMEEAWGDVFSEQYEGANFRALLIQIASRELANSMKMYLIQSKHLGVLGDAFRQITSFQIKLLRILEEDK